MNNNNWFIKLTSLVFLYLVCSTSFAQEKQKIPAEFFTGKFYGVLQGSVWDNQSRPWRINFTIDLYGQHAGSLEGVLMPYGLKGGGSALMSHAGIPSYYFMEDGKKYYEFTGIYLLFDVGENPSSDVLTVATPFAVKLLDSKVDLGSGAIIIDHVWLEADGKSGFSVKGTLHKITKIERTFPKDIKPNEPIKTDKKSQLEIKMPSKDVIKVAQNTEAVIRSESLMEVVKGKIHGLIKKLKPKTKFDVKTPTSAFSVRGTEYTVEVEDDSTTTVNVLDGEIELSDKENKKTVIVKKNQKSVVKPGALPTEPEEIDPEKILNWWR